MTMGTTIMIKFKSMIIKLINSRNIISYSSLLLCYTYCFQFQINATANASDDFLYIISSQARTMTNDNSTIKNGTNLFWKIF
ncbi:MAG: hypothetical protein OMM_12132 [Candidatus Magnetoglobus multicellularis str. Araruama]|uniref:Uncharacterized protein n=1 Tax=Candidatus Magnetoglobus multicellularis str. Araruama TaxID=890399 RepID=A0A1V1NWI0_9BACT|nr:MAG: hypothetical protein OMM_12132 [Candidatus Magnetoglobus multicellularis str. Araruama]